MNSNNLHSRWRQSTFPRRFSAVSLTTVGLTSVFGMGTGISPRYIGTTNYEDHYDPPTV